MTQGRAAGKPAPARAGARARRARGAGVGFAVGPGARGGRCGHSAALSAALSATSHCDCGPAQHLHYFKCRYISCGCLLVFVFWYPFLACPPRFLLPPLLPSSGVRVRFLLCLASPRPGVATLRGPAFFLSCVPIGFSGSSRLFEILWVEEDKYIDAHRVRG